MALKRWKRLSSTVKLKNGYWSYRLDEFSIGDEVRGEYHYVHTDGSTMVVPVTDEGNVLLVKQYRYLVDRDSIEFPSGGIIHDLTPLENALKELREETGQQAAAMTELGRFAPYNGVADEYCYVFLARELSEAPLRADATEEFELLSLTPDEIDEAIDRNEIFDGMTMASWSLARRKLRNLL